MILAIRVIHVPEAIGYTLPDQPAATTPARVALNPIAVFEVEEDLLHQPPGEYLLYDATKKGEEEPSGWKLRGKVEVQVPEPPPPLKLKKLKK